MTEILFHAYSLRGTLENHTRNLVDEANSMGEDKVLNTPQEDLIEYLVEKHRIPQWQSDESGIGTDYGDTQIDISRNPRYAVFDRSRPLHIIGTRVSFYVPFTGDPDLFRCQPSTSSTSPPQAVIRPNELTFTYDRIGDRTSGIKGEFERDFEQTRVHIETGQYRSRKTQRGLA